MSNTEEFVPVETVIPTDTVVELKKSAKKVKALKIALAATTVIAIGALVYFKATEADEEADEEGWTIVPTPETDTPTSTEE